MTIDRLCALVGWGAAFIELGLPCLMMLAPQRIVRLRFTLTKVLIVTVVCWFAAVAYRMVVEVPVYSMRSLAEGDGLNDGVGGTAAVILCGWLFPLASALVTLAIGRLVMLCRRVAKP